MCVACQRISILVNLFLKTSNGSVGLGMYVKMFVSLITEHFLIFIFYTRYRFKLTSAEKSCEFVLAPVCLPISLNIICLHYFFTTSLEP